MRLLISNDDGILAHGIECLRFHDAMNACRTKLGVDIVDDHAGRAGPYRGVRPRGRQACYPQKLAAIDHVSSLVIATRQVNLIAYTGLSTCRTSSARSIAPNEAMRNRPYECDRFS